MNSQAILNTRAQYVCVNYLLSQVFNFIKYHYVYIVLHVL